MKTIILTVLLSASAIAFAACQTTPTTNKTNTAFQNSNTNSAMSMNGMNHNGMMNGNSMNHNGMMMDGNSNMSGMMDMKSSPNAASQPYDLQFLDTMSHHHQGAIVMAETAAIFFKAGGASGTVAKTMSAYDMTFSDAIYGTEVSGRYVVESRLMKMLSKEYSLLEKRLSEKRRIRNSRRSLKRLSLIKHEKSRR